MFHYPYFGMPYYNRYSRYGYKFPNYTYYNSNNISNENNNFKNKTTINPTNYKKNASSKESIYNLNNSEFNKNQDVPLFQMFGINLYFDDILLICLIWFLYNEGVKDDSLFIVLILLLLS